MKKIFAFMLSSVLFIGLFTLNVFADDDEAFPGFIYGDGYGVEKTYLDTNLSQNWWIKDLYNDRETMPFYFALIRTRTDNNELYYYYFDTPNLEYDESTRTLSKSDGSPFHYCYSGWSKNGRSSMAETTEVTELHLPDIPLGIILQDTNLKIAGYNDFDPNNPPAPFTYTIDRPGFTLKNGNDSVNVQIRWTDEYIDWCNKLKELQPTISHDLGYNFCIYISTVKPTNTATLLQSMKEVNFIHLNYSEYVYEGGAGYASLSDGSSYHEGEPPTSHSGKSPWTTAKGVNICEVSQPDVDPSTGKYTNSTLFIPFYTENVFGTVEHQKIYVCVLGRNSSQNQPNVFNEYNVQLDLTNHLTPNDTFIEYYETHAEADNEIPDYTVHNYYFPFECVELAFGDGYQGSTVYMPQVINGQEFETHSPISSFTNKAITPDLIHDIDMQEGQWVKPEDYHAWQVDYYNKHQYDSNFEYGVQSFKDIFDEEGSFFKFIGSAFSAFPPYVLNIFIAFLVSFLAIVLLKFVL